MKSLNLFGLALSLLAVAGCATVREKTAETVTGGMKSTERMRQIRVFVSVGHGTGGGSAEAAPRILATVQDALADSGLSVTTSADDAEGCVACQVACTDVTGRGARLALRGSLQVKVLRRAAGSNKACDVIAARTFDGRGAEGFSLPESAGELAKSFEPELRKWLGLTARQLASEVAVSDITLSELRPPHTVRDGFPTRLAERALGIPGVYDCRVQSVGGANDRLSVSVFYDRRKIPEGVLNRMISLGLFK